MKNKKIIIIRIILIFLILGWMNIVFGFSAQESESSSSLSTWVASWFSDDTCVQSYIEPYIRKIAHFSEYGVGGALFISLFSTFDLSEMKKVLFSSVFGIIYAITDEIHQLFVPGRSGQPADVWIDTLGFVTGIFVMCFILKVLIILKNKIKNNISKIYS